MKYQSNPAVFAELDHNQLIATRSSWKACTHQTEIPSAQNVATYSMWHNTTRSVRDASSYYSRYCRGLCHFERLTFPSRSPSPLSFLYWSIGSLLDNVLTRVENWLLAIDDGLELAWEIWDSSWYYVEPRTHYADY